MENRTYAIAVGAFTLLLGFFLLFSFWWLNGDHKNNIHYLVASPLPVTGLSVESAVKFRGVDVGKVTDIALDATDKSMIQITIQVREDLVLTPASYAELRMQGITGLAYIDLNDLGTSDSRLPAGAKIPLNPSLMDKLMSGAPALISQIEILIKNSNELANTANQLLSGIDHEKLNQTLANLETASGKLEPLLNNASTALNSVGKMASEQNQALLAETLSSVRKTAEAAQPLFNELNSTAQEFRSMARQIEQDSQQLSHTLNHETLPHIHTLTENMNRDLHQFGTLLNALEENPQSLIFGKPESRPGPGESGFNPEN